MVTTPAAAPAPVLVTASGGGWAVPLVRVGAAAASLGALLALVAGVGRTALAMARNRDLHGRQRDVVVATEAEVYPVRRRHDARHAGVPREAQVTNRIGFDLG